MKLLRIGLEVFGVSMLLALLCISEITGWQPRFTKNSNDPGMLGAAT